MKDDTILQHKAHAATWKAKIRRYSGTMLVPADIGSKPPAEVCCASSVIH